MRKTILHIAIILSIVAAMNIVAHCFVVRYDMTDDKRYSLHETTKSLLQGLDDDIIVTSYLSGELNSGFQRLQKATEDLFAECRIYAPCRLKKAEEADYRQMEKAGLSPIVIHEREKDGRTAQTTVWPYLQIQYKGRSAIVALLQNNRTQSGEENLNQSIEKLEYQIAEAIHQLTQEETARVAFLEGHGELPEANVMDITMALSRYFQIDRGTLGNDANVLKPYSAVIIADPQMPFSETDKYILDSYVQQGGNILWLLNGVQFSSEILSNNGFTPAIQLDLNLTDILFRYGIKVLPALIQDQQCATIPVNISTNEEQPNYQPLPWFYAPLLLTSQASDVTKGIAPISSSFVSPIEFVGGDDGLRKEVLLASSSASRMIGVPAEIDLGDLNPDQETFKWAFIPVGASVEGLFPSVFAHRMAPEGVIEARNESQEARAKSRQVFIASGSIIRNEIQQGQVLPAGYDRYTRMSYGNRDLIVNLVLWLTDKEGLMSLRGKEITLRLLNDRRARDERQKIQIISTLLPIAILALVGLLIYVIKKHKYTRP